MEQLTIEIRDPDKRAFLLSLLRELSFVSVKMPSEQATVPPWDSYALRLKPPTSFLEVVKEQGNKRLPFADLAGSLSEELDGTSLDDLLTAIK